MLKSYNDIYTVLKNRLKKEKVKKEELQSVYNKFEEIKKIEAEADQKIQAIKEDIQKTDLYILHGSLYCNFLEELND